MTRSITFIGLCSGVACAVLSVAFTLLLVADMCGAHIGAFTIVPVLMLAPCFLLFAAVVLETAGPDHETWALTAFGCAIPYAAIVSVNYLMQLTVVRAAPVRYAWLAMSFAPGSAFCTMELLGYGWQALSLLAMVPVFHGRTGDVLVRWVFVVNFLLTLMGGVLFIATQEPMHAVMMASFGFWCLCFPAGMALAGYSLWRSNLNA